MLAKNSRRIVLDEVPPRSGQNPIDIESLQRHASFSLPIAPSRLCRHVGQAIENRGRVGDDA
jgi:hypothetical protein